MVVDISSLYMAANMLDVVHGHLSAHELAWGIEGNSKPPDSREVRGLRNSAAWYYKGGRSLNKTHQGAVRLTRRPKRL